MRTLPTLKTLAALLLCAACASSPAPGANVSMGAHGPDLDVHALKLRDYDGGVHDLEALLDSGRPVVLVFWQTWCSPCMHEVPALAAAAREHTNLYFLGVVPGDAATVDEQEVRRVASRTKMPYPQVLDRDLALTGALEVLGTPTIVVLGKGGKTIYRGHDADVPWGELGR